MIEQYFSGMPIWLLGLIFSLFGGLCTGVGALAVFFLRKKKWRYQDAFLGFGAGVMLAAISFSLIVPGIEYGGGGLRGAVIIIAGMLLGGILIWVSDVVLPHDFFVKKEGKYNLISLRRTWIFILAITLHNFPEGLAVGVGFGGGDIANGISLAIAIGLQNIPEGLAVAFALISQSYSRKKSFLIGFASGLVEPIGGLLGAGIVSIFAPILPWALGFAAGAMLFVIAGEIIPESQKAEKTRLVTFSVLVGFVIMLFMDVVLG